MIRLYSRHLAFCGPVVTVEQSARTWQLHVVDNDLHLGVAMADYYHKKLQPVL